MAEKHDNDAKTSPDDGDTTKGQGGHEVIPLAAAAFLGALAGALIGAVIT